MSAVIAICIGACVGALARWQLGVHFNQNAALPWGTLYANLIGGYLIGVCVAVFNNLPELDPVWRARSLPSLRSAAKLCKCCSALALVWHC